MAHIFKNVNLPLPQAASPSGEPSSLGRRTSPRNVPWLGNAWNQRKARSWASGWPKMRWKRLGSGRRMPSARSSHTVKSFQSPSSGRNSYMDEFEHNLITTMYHRCIIENMFWSQVILSISVLFSSTYCICVTWLANLARQWVYDEDVNEYYVITDDKTLLKKAERTTEREETQLHDTWFIYNCTLGMVPYIVHEIIILYI